MEWEHKVLSSHLPDTVSEPACVCSNHSNHCRDIPLSLPILRVGVADFDGDGVTDIVSFSNTTETGDCCLATIHWCRLRSDGTIAVSGELVV